MVKVGFLIVAVVFGHCGGLALYAMVGDIEWSKWVFLIVAVVFEWIWALRGFGVVCHGGRYRMVKVDFFDCRCGI